MKTLRNIFIALTIVAGSASLSGCMQNFDDMEQVNSNNDSTNSESNPKEWN